MDAGRKARPAFAAWPTPGVNPAVSPQDPIMGTWRADPSRSRCAESDGTAERKRYGARPPKNGELRQWRFMPEGQGVRLQHFTDRDTDAAGPALVDFFSTWDGRPWADPHGPAFLGELVQHWYVDPRLIIRLVLDNVAPPERLEWSAYAVSADGRTLAVTSWGHVSPEVRALHAFDRHGETIHGDVRRGR